MPRDPDPATGERTVDVLVIGSGAAGLSGALAAAAGGLDVLVAEKSRYVGGTSAMSGGCAWVPCNHHMAKLGETDSPEEAVHHILSGVTRDFGYVWQPKASWVLGEKPLGKKKRAASAALSNEGGR